MGGGGFGEGGRKGMGAGNGFGRKWVWHILYHGRQ